MRALLAAVVLTACGSEPTIEAVSRLGATIDTEGPYVVEAVVVGAQGGDQVELGYAVGAPEDFIPLVMAERDPDVFVAGIPGQPAPSTLHYYVAVVRDGEVLVTAPAGGPLAFDVLE
jgi:hypothetical protein